MILKAKHIYRVDIVNGRNTKNYCLIAPKNDFDTDNPPNCDGCTIDCVVCIDVLDECLSNTRIYFTFHGNCVFKNPSVSDIFEMADRMRGMYRYDFKNGEIKKL